VGGGEGGGGVTDIPFSVEVRCGDHLRQVIDGHRVPIVVIYHEVELIEVSVYESVASQL